MSNVVTIDGREYDLRLTRKGLRSAESAGLNLNDMSTAPFSQIPLMFMALVYADKGHINYSRAEDLTDEMFDSDEMSISAFIEMFSEQLSDVFESTAKGKKKATPKKA